MTDEGTPVVDEDPHPGAVPVTVEDGVGPGPVLPVTVEQAHALTDEALGALMSLVWAEQSQREVMRQAADEAERLAARYLEARDGGAVQSVPLPPGPGPDGQPVVDPGQPTVALSDIAVWVQPTGAHDAYPQRYPVQHGGRVWRSLVAGNVWEPGADGPVPTWEDITGLSTIITPAGGDDDTPPDVDPDVNPGAGVPPAWVEGATYEAGARVTYQGHVWECVSKHTAWAGTGWTPDVTPAMWKRMED